MTILVSYTHLYTIILSQSANQIVLIIANSYFQIVDLYPQWKFTHHCWLQGHLWNLFIITYLFLFILLSSVPHQDEGTLISFENMIYLARLISFEKHLNIFAKAGLIWNSVWKNANSDFIWKSVKYIFQCWLHFKKMVKWFYTHYCIWRSCISFAKADIIWKEISENDLVIFTPN